MDEIIFLGIVRSVADDVNSTSMAFPRGEVKDLTSKLLDVLRKWSVQSDQRDVSNIEYI